MNRFELQKRALATRDAHLALLDLKRLVDEAAQRTHAAELEAIGLAISREQQSEISTTLRVVVEHLRSDDFETMLTQAKEKLEIAISTEPEA